MTILISVAISTYLAHTLMRVHSKRYHANKKPCSCPSIQQNGSSSITEPTENGNGNDDEEPITVGEIVDNLGN